MKITKQPKFAWITTKDGDQLRVYAEVARALMENEDELVMVADNRFMKAHFIIDILFE